MKNERWHLEWTLLAPVGIFLFLFVIVDEDFYLFEREREKEHLHKQGGREEEQTHC